ncbi:MAG: sigma-70 family RNA polymerase sigma factor [Clostridiales bacterium]|jgi:RNA polymerase sigma-70 factor (ECF subfamily)|nr:sigma-70 family RNA polymerase sigma factor [Clostridiales bacterium]
MAWNGVEGEALLERAARGDGQAFEMLIADYEKLIFTLAFRMLGNTQDARDASQETLIKVYNNLHKCHDIRSFKSWVTTITNHTCIDELRRRKGKRDESLNKIIEAGDSEFTPQFKSDGPGPEERLLSKERQEHIQRAINRLPVKYKQLIVLRDIGGLSYEELAETAGLSMGTVKSRLSRARIKLQQYLSGE